MNTDDLEVFIKAYEYLNYTRTADEFFITPQGVSKIIRRLENELDCTLFERTRQGVKPTQEAHILAAYTHTVLENTELMKASLKNPFYAQKSILKVAFTTGMMSFLTPEFWNSFQEKYPDIQLKLSEYTDCETDSILRSDQAEIGFQSEPIDFTYYDAVPFTRHEFFAAMNVNHPLAQKEKISFSDLHNQELCILGPDYFSYNQNMNHFMNAGAVPKNVYTTKDLVSIESYASSSGVIGFCLDFVAAKYLNPAITFLRFEPAYYWHTFIIKKKGRTLTPGAEAFIQHALHWIKRKPFTI